MFLPEEEVDRLFDLIRTVVTEGAAVLFISHDLAAVQAITERVVVLRDGRVVAEEVTADINEESLVDLIVGASASARQAAVDTSNVVALVEDERAAELTREAMQSVGDAPGQGESFTVEHLFDERLHDVSFEIGAGEILGVAGLIGSGAEELPYLLFGARQAISGSLHLGAERLNVGKLTPQRSVRERIALVPADRAAQGLSQGLTLWENIVMLVEDEHYRNGIFRRGELEKLARDAIDQFLIRPPLAYAPMGTFSGGNQQKALMAKWLIARPRLLLLHEPTQGVDVGARRDIYRFVKAAATLNQMAVLWVTTEFGELAEVCDRVIVITQGRHTDTLTGEELSEEAISAAALRQTRRSRERACERTSKHRASANAADERQRGGLMSAPNEAAPADAGPPGTAGRDTAQGHAIPAPGHPALRDPHRVRRDVHLVRAGRPVDVPEHRQPLQHPRRPGGAVHPGDGGHAADHHG